MKNFKNVVSVITIALLMLVSFNVNAQKSEYSKEQIEDVKTKLRQGMNLFVESVKPFYKKGMSFEEYKLVLIGKNNKNITKEGNALLGKAYSYLSKNKSSKDILTYDSGEEFARAFMFVNSQNKTNKSKSGDLILFGNPTGGTYPNSIVGKAAAPCRWYQLGCWWNQIFGDYSDEILGLLLNLLFP
ncbi:hypothetical protein [Lacinutrix sp. MEBiC02595]